VDSAARAYLGHLSGGTGGVAEGVRDLLEGKTMPEFIRVTCPDRFYKGAVKRHVLLNIQYIVQAVPVTVEIKEDVAWLCTDKQEKAGVIAYMFVDDSGNEFLCDNREELKRIGLEIQPGDHSFSVVRRAGKDDLHLS
jgi:hypothetical protein